MTNSHKIECPKCHKMAGVDVPTVSADSWMDYYRCVACGNVWVLPKETERQSQPSVQRVLKFY